MKTQLTQLMQVVMLPTDKTSSIWKDNDTNYLNYSFDGKPFYKCTPQHLYVVSDNEIKNGDWGIDYNLITGTNIFQCKGETTSHYQCSKYSHEKMCCKKIEGTNVTLVIFQYAIPLEAGKRYSDIEVPQIYQSFIETYVKSEGKITEVLVEMEADMSNTPYTSDKQNHALKILKESSNIGVKVKTNSNNEIIIHLPKLYTQQEVDNLLDAERCRTTNDVLKMILKTN